jgi:TetR/AcrR family transcriptional regulator, fatty acid metabolism regulator protein
MISDRQLEIIKAAGQTLTESGVGGLTIKNLAKAMEFSESAIYRHFTSKEEIIVAMLEYLAGSLDKLYAKAVSDEQNPEAKFMCLLRAQLEFFHENPYFVVAVYSDGLLEESDRVNSTILKIMGIAMKHLMPIIMEGQQKGFFTNAITTEELMHVVMGAFRLQMFKWRLSNFNFDIIRNGENLIQAVITIIKPK